MDCGRCRLQCQLALLAWRAAGEGIANFKPQCQFIPPQKVDELIINALSNVKSVPIRSINCNGSIMHVTRKLGTNI